MNIIYEIKYIMKGKGMNIFTYTHIQDVCINVCIYEYTCIMYIWTSEYFYLPVEDWGESYNLREVVEGRGGVHGVRTGLLNPGGCPWLCV